MKIQARTAIVNGFTSQLTPTVVAIPRQWRPTCPKAVRSIFEQHRHDHEPDQHRHGNIDLRHGRFTERVKDAGQQLAERNTDDDAERHPEGEKTLEHAHRGRFAYLGIAGHRWLRS